MSAQFGNPNCTNEAVISWVEKMAKICGPERLFWCDGSAAERECLTQRAVEEKILLPLDGEKWPGCHYHRSKSNDVARVEELTFICTPSQDQAGPTNNWALPSEMYAKLYGMCGGGMHGRTMYVVPYLMGPAGSPLSKVGFELTDSLYVVLSMGVMTRMGGWRWSTWGRAGILTGAALHAGCGPGAAVHRAFSAGQHDHLCGIELRRERAAGEEMPCAADRVVPCAAGGVARGAYADPGGGIAEGEKTFVAAAFPSACGKTNFAMMIPPERYKDWKIWTVGMTSRG